MTRIIYVPGPEPRDKAQGLLGLLALVLVALAGVVVWMGVYWGVVMMMGDLLGP